MVKGHILSPDILERLRPFKWRVRGFILGGVGENLLVIPYFIQIMYSLHRGILGRFRLIEPKDRLKDFLEILIAAKVFKIVKILHNDSKSFCVT